MSEDKVVISPCMSVCTSNKEGVCVGCCRSSDEILQWHTYSNEKKQGIVDDIPIRREKMKSEAQDSL